MALQISDPEPLIAVLKSCLRHANQHLSTATLAALPPFIPLVVANPSRSLSPSLSTSSVSGTSLDVAMLRQVMNAFCVSPGVFERLGDAREKARDKARETLVIIGGFAFRSPPTGSRLGVGKGHEPPLAVFERLLKDNGLNSKVWRVREQVSLYFQCSWPRTTLFLLVDSRSRAHPPRSHPLSYSTISVVVGGRSGRHGRQCSYLCHASSYRALHWVECD